MRTVRAIGMMMMAALANMAEATATTFRWTLKAGRWVLESVAAPPRPPAAPGNEAAAAVEALAEASKIATSAPAPAVAVDDKYDPVAAWGRTVQAYGRSRFNGTPAPDLGCLDGAAQAWLRGLRGADYARLGRVSARAVGEHMLGIAAVPGVPRCPSAAEHAERERIAPKAGLVDAVEPDDVNLEDGLHALTSSPGWTPNTGIH